MVFRLSLLSVSDKDILRHDLWAGLCADFMAGHVMRCHVMAAARRGRSSQRRTGRDGAGRVTSSGVTITTAKATLLPLFVPTNLTLSRVPVFSTTETDLSRARDCFNNARTLEARV